MPSGVFQGATVGALTGAASAKSTLAKSGIWLIGSPVLVENIVSGAQCRQGIAAGINEALHARCFQRCLKLARPAGKIDVPGARGFQGFRRACRSAFIGFVCAAETDEQRTGGLERGGMRLQQALDGLDAAGLEEILGEVGARTEVGWLA